MSRIKPGKYQHYKGNLYEVIGVGRNSETMEEVVLYRALYDSPEFGNNSLWVRPKKMFLELIEHKGKLVPRFRMVS